MRLKTSLGMTALVSALLTSPVYAINCSISYYCYRSMTPGPAPVTTVATNRPNPSGNLRPANVQQPRPVNAPVVRPPTNPINTSTPIAQRNAPQPSTAAQRLAEQQRAQTLADQRRLAALRRNQANPAPTPRMTPPPQTPARVTATPAAPTMFRPVDNQSCNTLALKIKVLESQATSQARNQQQAKAQELFKVAADLRKQAQAKACTL